MMNDNMMSGGMMWAMGFVWLLVVILLILAIAALAKYVFVGRKKRNDTPESHSDVH
ncbi:hypothetical protein [Granulosicoccus sp. 3-233]|uniref:hypothetical protein n=1 Tax=Granulosicoccus sp. 3-233 TaxID=3417969 RepID=UPI003D34F082